VERAFVFSLLLFLMGAATAILYPDLRGEDVASTQGVLHPLIVIVQVAVYGLGALLILTRWRRVAAACLKVRALLLLMLLAPISAAWSIYPLLSLRRSVLQIVVFLCAVYLGERYSIEEFARLTAYVFCVVILVTPVLFVVAPNLVLDPDHAKAWKGLSDTKNAFGLHMAMAFVLLLLVRFKRVPWLRYIFIFMAFAEMGLSRSMTSVATGVLVIVMLPLWALVRLNARQRFAALLAMIMTVAAGGYVLSLKMDAILRLMGKDSTLTGRTDVWKALLVAIGHHPFLGYGFGSFWTGLRGESLDVIVASGWLVPEAHNGYLELWLAMGLPGAILFLVALWFAIRYAIRYIRSEPRSVAYWPAAFFCFFLIHNMGESDLMNNGAFFLMSLFLTISTSLAVQVSRINIQAPEEMYSDTSSEERVRLLTV
jgi:O-antigen ligase